MKMKNRMKLIGACALFAFGPVTLAYHFPQLAAPGDNSWASVFVAWSIIIGIPALFIAVIGGFGDAPASYMDER
jgi:hypothetical protein